MRVELITSVPLNPPWDQGDKNLAYTLTRFLPDINFTVLTARNEPEPAGSNLHQLPLFRNRVPSMIEKASIYWWYLRKPLIGRQENNIDLYHLSYQPFGFSSRMLRWLPEFRRVPSIHTVPATATSHQLSSSYFFADRVVALSNYGRQKLIDLGLKDVVYIPIGIDPEEWKLSPDKVAESKINLGVEGKKVLLFPGHYNEAYGIDDLLAAMPKISRFHADVVYIMACRMRSKKDWDMEKLVQQEVEKMGLTHAVMFLQTIDDMKTVISASDVVLMPFKTMRDKIDIPTTLLEAMAAGKPIVISDTPPMNELIRYDGRLMGAENVGLLHKSGDAEELADSILKILNDNSLRLAMSENGLRLVRTRFDISMVASQYRDQYSELVS
jgi:glycosyltransferase involved in cell wall biosynthesis